MLSVDLFSPSFQGSRFDDHTLPFDILGDLSAYQDLLLLVAKDIYYEQNSSQRVPKGFGHGVYLKLEQIEEGSTIPKILLAAASFFASNVDTQPYFEQAQQRIIEAVHQANLSQDVGTLLSPAALNQFNKFGRSLRADESLDLAPGSARPAKLTPTTRRQLLLSVPGVSSVEEIIDVRGSVSAISKDPFTLTIVTLDKLRFTAPIDPQYFGIATEAFANYEAEKLVLVSGTGVYGRNGRLENIKDVREVILLDEMDVPTQLEKLHSLEDGWFDGDGQKFDRSNLNWLSRAFDNYVSRTLLLPFTFPTVEGGIQFEWKRGEHDATLEVNLTDKTAYLHYYNSASDTDDDRDLDLNNAGAWEELNQYLIQYFTV